MMETEQQKNNTELNRETETPYARKKQQIPEQNKSKKRKRMSGNQGNSFWKAAVNGFVLLLDGFLLALIVCLFLAQPKHGQQVKATIRKFSVNSDQYYSEHETYEQVNANVHVYESEGRPD